MDKQESHGQVTLPLIKNNLLRLMGSEMPIRGSGPYHTIYQVLLRRWLCQQNVTKRVTLCSLCTQATIFIDVSKQGGGAHMDSLTASGSLLHLWQYLTSNWLELEAIMVALGRFT